MAIDFGSDEQSVAKPSKANPTQACWLDKMAHTSNKKRHGKSIGFGLFYLREPFQYTESKFKAEPANNDRVRIVNLKESDWAERELCDDDLHKELDWYDRTSINLMIWTA